MNANEVKEQCEKEILGSLALTGLANFFRVEWGDILCEDGEMVTVEGDIVFLHGPSQINHKHGFFAGWREDDGCGYEMGEDGDICEIKPALTLELMYFCLAFRDFAGEV